MSGDALGDNVAATETAHHGGMRNAGGNIAAIAGAVEMRFAVDGEGHFAAEDDVSGFGGMSVIGIDGIGPIGPKVSVRKTFALQLGGKPSFVQHVIQPFREIGPSKTATPSCCPPLAVRDKEGALSSSGEKIVKNREQAAHRPKEEAPVDAASLACLCADCLP